MNVIPITLVISLVLTALFIVLFARDLARRRFTSAESDSLLPLADEQPRTVPVPLHHEHAHEGGRCKDPQRPACSRCRRRVEQELR